MKQIEFIEAFLTKSDKEIVQFAKQYDVDLSIEEVRKLRPLVDKASFTWILTGIPKTFLKEVEKVIGKKKLKKLMKIYDSYTQ